MQNPAIQNIVARIEAAGLTADVQTGDVDTIVVIKDGDRTVGALVWTVQLVDTHATRIKGYRTGGRSALRFNYGWANRFGRHYEGRSIRQIVGRIGVEV